MKQQSRIRRSTVEALVFLTVLIAVFSLLGWRMGSGNMLKTIMNTAHDLLLNTVFYLMGITVLTGALSKLMSEFGVVTLLERFLRPLMKPLYNLPGVAALGAVMTFLSDNPAIIALSKDKTFSAYFKKYQLISLTNFGTAFGMGFVVMITMIGYGHLTGALVGLFGAFCGSIISTRLMQRSCLKAYPELDSPVQEQVAEEIEDRHVEESKKDGIFMRFLNAILDGGKNGVELGLQIIPGVLIITTAVIMIFPDDLVGRGGGFAGPAAHLQRCWHPGRQRHSRVHRQRHVLERLPVHPHRHAGLPGLPQSHLQGHRRARYGRPLRGHHRPLRVPAGFAPVGSYARWAPAAICRILCIFVLDLSSNMGKRNNKSKHRSSRKKKTRVVPEFVGKALMSREGFIFVRIEGQEEDVYVKASKTRGALHGDTVRVAVSTPARPNGAAGKSSTLWSGPAVRLWASCTRWASRPGCS